MIIAAKPAELLGKPGFEGLESLLGPSDEITKRFGVRLSELAQITVVWLRPVAAHRPPNGPMLPPPSVVVLQSVAARDWKNLTSHVVAEHPEEVVHVGQSFVRTAKAPDGAAYYQPSERTIVISEHESALRQYLSARLIPNEHHAWDSALSALPGGQMGGAVDSTFVAQVLEPALSQPDAASKLDMFAPLWAKAQAHAITLKAAKGLSLAYAATCDSDDGANRVAKTVDAMLTLATNALPGLKRTAPDNSAPVVELFKMADDALNSAKITRDGRTVRLEASGKVEVASFVKSVLTPVVASSRTTARRAQSTNNLRQLALAMHNYASANGGKFPPAVVVNPNGNIPHSWRIELLPYLGEKELYDRYRMNEPWDSPANRELLNARPAVYAVPGAEVNNSNACYFAVTGRETLFPSVGQGSAFTDITDGLSNTIMFVEAKREIPWTKPKDIVLEPGGRTPKLGGFEPESGGFNAVFADGAARFVKDSIDPAMLRALFTRAGGEVVSY
jgi:hypothetical protein